MAKSKTAHGVFKPTNQEKIIGKAVIEYRSSWELRAFITLDRSPNVIKWASESIEIPYYDPVTKKQRIYYPDLFVLYKDKTGKEKSAIFEIKPLSQTVLENTKSKYDKLQLVTNLAKWKAAMAFCQKAGITFRVITEKDLFF